MEPSVASRLKHLRGSGEHWLGVLEEMVAVDSGPGDSAGAQRMVDVLTDLWGVLGWEVHVDQAGAPVVIARRPGPGPRLLLLGHYDTVFPAGTAAVRPFHVREGRATGPGAADMKAGLVVQAAAMSVVRDERCDLTVLVNGDEESGSVGSRHLIESMAADMELVLVFEPGEPDGAIVTGRPGVRRFALGTVGRAAHSGVEPEKGRNAIEGIAHLVLAVAQLGRRGDLGTVTVSTIHGGTRPNIVPEEANILIDARVPTEQAGARLAEELASLVSDVPVEGVSAWLEALEQRPAFVASQSSRRTARRLRLLGSEAGIDVDARPARGSSDGNFTAGMGVPTIDGLGPPGGGFHTADEWLTVDGIFSRAAMVAGLVDETGSQGA